MSLPEIYVAAKEGNAERVVELVRQGHDPNITCDPAPDYGAFLAGITPLMAAAASPRSDAATVAALLAGGADPFAVSAGGVTALWYAAGGGTNCSDYSDMDDDDPFRDWGGGDAERLLLLLQAGLSANDGDTRGRTAIFEACSLGAYDRAALLIEHGASVVPGDPVVVQSDLPDEFRELMEGLPEELKLPEEFAYTEVPLFAAVETGDLAFVKLITDQGFPLDYTFDGENALNYATTVEMVEFLLNGGVKVLAGRFGSDSIDDAFDDERYSVAIALINRVQDPEERQRVRQEKLLNCSGVRMNPEAVRLLLADGADAKALDEGLGSPLHYACWQGDGNGGQDTAINEVVLRLLLEGGADPNQMARGERPLHEAVDGDWDSPTAVRVLLEFGAQADAENENGETPLMLAATHGRTECMRLLLAAGANPHPALVLAQQHLETWKEIVNDPPKHPLLTKVYSLSPDEHEYKHRHQEALLNAAEAYEMVVEAIKLRS